MITPSPCIGTCRIDEASTLCTGCARTREEIASWRDVGDDIRRRIWTELPERRAALGLNLHRLDWTQNDIRSFISQTLRAHGGTWVFGIFGAVAEFCIGTDEDVELDLGAACLVAKTARAAVRFELSEQVRGLTLSSATETSNQGVIVLAIPRSRSVQKEHFRLTALGPDRNAIREENRDEHLFDLGLGTQAAGFCVRTSDPDLIRELNARVGQSWTDLLAGLGGRILEVSPTRVIQSSVGRVEVFTRIPLPGGVSPAGPHTHLLPPLIARGLETPPGLELPDVLIPCAIFYPGSNVVPDDKEPSDPLSRDLSCQKD